MERMADTAPRLVAALDDEALSKPESCTNPAMLEAGRIILEAVPDLQLAMIPLLFKDNKPGYSSTARFHLLSELLRRKFRYTSTDLEQIVSAAAHNNQYWGRWNTMLVLVQRYVTGNEWTPALREAVQRIFDTVGTHTKEG